MGHSHPMHLVNGACITGLTLEKQHSHVLYLVSKCQVTHQMHPGLNFKTLAVKLEVQFFHTCSHLDLLSYFPPTLHIFHSSTIVELVLS